jgi:hypothetical protein
LEASGHAAVVKLAIVAQVHARQDRADEALTFCPYSKKQGKAEQGQHPPTRSALVKENLFLTRHTGIAREMGLSSAWEPLTKGVGDAAEVNQDKTCQQQQQQNLYSGQCAAGGTRRAVAIGKLYRAGGWAASAATPALPQPRWESMSEHNYHWALL